MGDQTISLRFTFDSALQLEEKGLGNSIAMSVVDVLRLVANHGHLIQVVEMCSELKRAQIVPLLETASDVDVLTRAVLRTFYRFRGASDSEIDTLFQKLEGLIDAEKDTEDSEVVPPLAQTLPTSGRSRGTTSNSEKTNLKN